MKTNSKKVKAAPAKAPGLCFLFLCWDARTEDHTLELVLCHRCQHSLAWGIDPAKKPRKATKPGKGKNDPPVVLSPLAEPCQWCHAYGHEPSYEADEMERQRLAKEEAEREAARFRTPRLAAPTHAVDEDGQGSLF